MARVLVIGRGAPDRGGITAFLGGLMQGDLAEAHELELLNLTPAVTPTGGRLRTANVLRMLRDTVRVLRSAPRHDLVHIHSALAPAVTLLRAAMLALAARIRGTPVGLHAHGGLLAGWLDSPGRRRFARLLLAPVDVVVPSPDPSPRCSRRSRRGAST